MSARVVQRIVLLASTCASALAGASCSGRPPARADALCRLAEEVAADADVAPGKRFIAWAHRANREVDAELVHRFMADVRERGDPSRATIERSVSAAIGAPWTCPAIDTLFPDVDHTP